MKTSFFTGLVLLSFIFIIGCCESEDTCCEATDKEHISDCVKTCMKAEASDIPDAITVIHNRKSVRSYTEDNVTREQLEILLRAGMAAPTAGNRQPWHFIAIEDRDLLKNLTNYLPFGQMLDHAAAAIVVCGDLSRVNLDGPEYWVQDCSAATQNILLAAEAIGLGAVWIGVYPSEERTEDLIVALELEENHIPLSVISIGYPDGEHEPKNKWDPEKVDWISAE